MKNQKGITLIALIITIIVMMILVAVSVTIALDSGLFKAAQSAASNTNQEATNELKLSEGKVTVDGVTYDSMQAYIDSLKGGSGNSGGNEDENDGEDTPPTIILDPAPTEISEGDIITGYVPASEYTSEEPYSVPTEYAGCTGTFYTDMGSDVEWKVLSVEGDTIRIMPRAVSSTELTLEGANGWNNSIDAINGVCAAIYGNTESELYTATATGLTVEDVNGITGYEVNEDYDSYDASYYGNNNKFPTAYLREEGITDFEESDGYAINSEVTVKDASYSYEFDSEGKRCWVASRSTWVANGYARFGVRWVGNWGYLGQNSLFDSTGESVTSLDDPSNNTNPVCPVVSLTANVAPTYEKTIGTGETAVNYWKFIAE